MNFVEPFEAIVLGIVFQKCLFQKFIDLWALFAMAKGEQKKKSDFFLAFR